MPIPSHSRFETSFKLWSLLLVLLALGCDDQTGMPPSPDAAEPPALGPVQVMLAVHIEGFRDEAMNADSFGRHVERVEDMRVVLERHGIIANLEVRTDQFLAGVENHGSDILQTWLAAGHGVEVHADLGGNHDNTMRLTRELGEHLQAMRDYGLEPTSVSGLCSEADWVGAAAHHSVRLVDGLVDYCLKSLPPENLPPEYSWVLDCTNPADCHDGVFGEELERSITPWRPLSADNWLVPGGDASMPILLVDGPWNGGLKCIAEPPNTPGSDCTLDMEDADVFDRGLDEVLAAREPGQFYGFIIGGFSIGAEVDTAGLDTVAAYLATEVQLGNIEFVTARQMVDRYEAWEATGVVPGATP